MALLVGAVTALAVLRVFGAVLSQALAHYELAISARRLRLSQIARVKEIEEAIQREAKARAEVNAQRAAILNPVAVPDEEVGVDILEAA